MRVQLEIMKVQEEEVPLSLSQPIGSVSLWLLTYVSQI